MSANDDHAAQAATAQSGSVQRVVREPFCEREMAGWQAVVVQTDAGIATRWRNPWHSPTEQPPANSGLLLHTPEHMNGDVQLGEHDGARWRTAEGVPLECEPALWCLTPRLPNSALTVGEEGRPK